MESAHSLQQVLYLIGLTGGAILGLELLLYGLLTFYQRTWFLPVVVGVAALCGASMGLLTPGEVGDGADVADAGETFGLPLRMGLFGLGGFFLAAVFRWGIRGRYKTPILMLAPAFLAVCLLIIYPFLFEIRLAFGNLKMTTIGRWLMSGELGWVGFQNFVHVFTQAPLQTATFWQLLGRTFLWTGINLVFHVGFGLGLALLLKRAAGKGLYRMFLIIPWAMPQVVAILAWRGEFHPQFGVVNHILEWIGLSAVPWWSDPTAVFVSCCIVNIWLGIPFMMIVFLGGLQSIPGSYYEAASIDGASSWTQFRQITLPMLKPVVVPSITLGTIWTFNNINVIYLLTGQDGGNEHADILVSALYKAAFSFYRYSYSAAFAVVIFVILFAMTAAWMWMTRDSQGEAA